MHTINMFDSDYIMRCSTAMDSVANTPKKIYLGGTLLYESASTYYEDKNVTFGLLFQQYKSSVVYFFIIHPLLNSGNLTCTGNLMKISSI